MPHTARFSFWRHLLAGALLVATPLLGWAQQSQADPPARVAYISALDGAALIAGNGQADWASAALNWPVTTGTQLSIEPGSRVELHGGWTALRLTGRANLDVTQLNDTTTQLALTEGALSVRVRELQPGERVEIDTPQLAVVVNQPGEYRLDVDPRSDTTRVTVHAGSVAVYGDAGQSSTLSARAQVTFAGRGLTVAQRSPDAYRDGLDQWAASRDALEGQSVSARYVSRDMPGYALLDNHGEWSQDPAYGAVWYPTVTVTDWAPYRYGRWTWVAPWGWTWVDDAPWGFAPSHYGRWAQIGPRWAWVPGPVAPRPVYAPALVGFVGGSSGGSRWGISVGSGLPAAAWFPLAPGEQWQPGYSASDRYRRRVNWDDPRFPARRPADGYLFLRRPNAVSVAPPGYFNGNDGRGGVSGNRPPRFGDGSRLPPGALGTAQLIAPPPRANLPPPAAHAPGAPPRPDFSRSPDPRAPLPRPMDGRGAVYGDDAAAARPMAPTGSDRNPREAELRPPLQPNNRPESASRPPPGRSVLPPPGAEPPRGNAPVMAQPSVERPGFERPPAPQLPHMDQPRPMPKPPERVAPLPQQTERPQLQRPQLERPQAPPQRFELPRAQPPRPTPEPERARPAGERANNAAPRERSRDERDGRFRDLSANH